MFQRRDHEINMSLTSEMVVWDCFRLLSAIFTTISFNIPLIHSESLNSSVYTVLVRPQLEYCSKVWCPFTDSNIAKLEAVKCRAARWIKHDYGQTSSVTEMMQSLHWRRFDKRRIDNKLSRVYKITYNLIAIPISDFLIPLVRPSRHYHPLSYRLITARNDYYKYEPESLSHIYHTKVI